MLTLDFLTTIIKKKDSGSDSEENIDRYNNGQDTCGKRINEQDICKAYNMSRTPVREILRRIEETAS
ncbi:MAG: hypothetical protein ACLTK0_08070 [Anaerovoracaceae bacterium]